MTKSIKDDTDLFLREYSKLKDELEKKICAQKYTWRRAGAQDDVIELLEKLQRSCGTMSDVNWMDGYASIGTSSTYLTQMAFGSAISYSEGDTSDKYPNNPSFITDEVYGTGELIDKDSDTVIRFIPGCIHEAEVKPSVTGKFEKFLGRVYFTKEEKEEKGLTVEKIRKVKGIFEDSRELSYSGFAKTEGLSPKKKNKQPYYREMEFKTKKERKI